MNPVTMAEKTDEAIQEPYDLELTELTEGDELPDNIAAMGGVNDQIMPGDDDPINYRDQPKRISAQRVTEVSDILHTGRSVLTGGTYPYLFIPAHRDRLRVTIQAIGGVGSPIPFIGSGPDVGVNNGWGIETSEPFTLNTRDGLWLMTGAGVATVTVQWITELVQEGCGCH